MAKPKKNRTKMQTKKALEAKIKKYKYMNKETVWLQMAGLT